MQPLMLISVVSVLALTRKILELAESGFSVAAKGGFMKTMWTMMT